MSTGNALQASRIAKHNSRKAVNAVAMVLCLSAMAFGLFWLAWILIETVRLGVGGLHLSIFTEMTPPPQAETGGLLKAIFGSLVMVGLATLLWNFVGINFFFGSGSQHSYAAPEPTAVVLRLDG